MGKVKIYSDSTCDLSPELIERYGVKIVPLCIVMDEKSYYDSEEVTSEQIFEWAERNKTTPKTAAIPFDRAENDLKPAMENGDEVIFFCISRQMSSTSNVIRMVAEQNEYDKIYVIDSQSLSTGIGLQVIKACELAEQGKSAQEIVDIIEAGRSRVRASFVVDTLTYLSRGGRCSAVTALMASAFKIHPMIVVKDGSMGVGKKYRGKLPVAITNYLDDLDQMLKNAEPERVFITHSGCEPEIVDAVRSRLEALGIFSEIHETLAGGVISSHCGPATLGVLFYEK